MPEAAPCTRAVGAPRRGIDGAEHSSTLERVMAGRRFEFRGVTTFSGGGCAEPALISNQNSRQIALTITV